MESLSVKVKEVEVTASMYTEQVIWEESVSRPVIHSPSKKLSKDLLSYLLADYGPSQTQY